MSRNRTFENWFSRKADLPEEMVSEMWNGETYEHYRYNVSLAWAAWQAGARGFQPSDEVV